MISVKEINEYTARDAERLKQLEIMIDGSLKLLNEAKRVVLNLGRIVDANVTKLQAMYDKGGWNLTYQRRSGRNEEWYEVVLEPKPTSPKQPNVR